jgi:hypothetical protein
MTLRCVLFGHALGAPVPTLDNRLVVKCAECDYVSEGIAVPAAPIARPITERWDSRDSYWATPDGQTWLNGERSAR